MDASTPSFAPHTKLTVFCLACAALGFIYGVANHETSSLAELFITAAPAVAVATWLAADAKRTRVSDVMDAGLFFYATWPISILWYAFKTRGRRGWRLIVRLYILAVAGVLGALMGAIVHVILVGRSH